MRLVASKDVFSIMEASVERLQEAEDGGGRERILITQNISSAVSHWLVPSYGMETLNIGMAAMKTIILCQSQRDVRKMTKEELDTAGTEFSAQSYTTLNEVVKELTDVDLTLKPEDKVSDLKEVIEKQKINSLNGNQIGTMLQKLDAVVSTGVTTALTQLNGFMLNIFENIKATEQTLYCSYSPGERKKLMDNKRDLFSFMTAIVKVYMMTFFLRIILWVANNVIRLKTDIKAL